MRRRGIEYLKKDIRQSIINDLRDVAEYFSRPDKTKEAGFFIIPREVFCYVDYLGKIAYGTSTTIRQIDFIKSYFPPHYSDYAELLVSMWRHGTVHEYAPISFIAQYPNERPKRIRVKWLSNNDCKQGNRTANMRFFPMEGTRCCVYLAINTCQLVDDLLLALEKFTARLESDTTLRRQCIARLNDAAKPQDISLKIRDERIRDAVSAQIRQAWRTRSTRIDRYGRTLLSNKVEQCR